MRSIEAFCFVVALALSPAICHGQILSAISADIEAAQTSLLERLTTSGRELPRAGPTEDGKLLSKALDFEALRSADSALSVEEGSIDPICHFPDRVLSFYLNGDDEGRRKYAREIALIRVFELTCAGKKAEIDASRLFFILGKVPKKDVISLHAKAQNEQAAIVRFSTAVLRDANFTDTDKLAIVDALIFALQRFRHPMNNPAVDLAMKEVLALDLPGDSNSRLRKALED
ncbi:hypothetical protein C5L14_20125 [Labrys okinawensis]|uniref:Uncharacterized protein n=1 Tax=Labrys okinawensis TaxID=346911 RepID=A0A2S9Q986_9HYPH|nr:hypothetical protein [Labrys okinawensis]PRH85854.1 hypothetical protein C5L14_20125 [Labrys okinawensis]